MGDSDEESERRRGRDKFMKERPDYNDRQRRDFPSDRSDNFHRRQGGNFGGQQRDFGGRGQGAQPQGFSNDLSSRRQGGTDLSPPMKRQRRDGGGDEWREPNRPVPAGPSMMTFKQFLATQDDTINDDEAVRKYQDYKLEYRRQMIHSFFVAHKDEEWFRLKYFPEDSVKRREEQLATAKRRMAVFMELMEKGWVDRARLDVDNLRNVVRMLDGVVIKLEGGTDEDLAVLETMEPDYLEDMPPEEERSKERDEEEDTKNKDEKPADDDASSNGEGKKKRKRTDDDEDGAISDSESDSGVSEKSGSKKSGVKKEPSEAGEWDEGEKKRSASAVDSNVQSEKKTTLLHRTSSLFLRNIAPTITKAEIEALCKKFPGYLRTSLAEPMAERMFYRRGWVTFRRDTNIKDIWWNMSNVRISCRHHSGVMKDCELGAIINRDLTRKHRTVNGTAAHKQVAKNDLRLITKLIQMYDAKAQLWLDDGEEKKDEPEKAPNMTFSSKNPLLANITDYLVEETSAEEEELLGNGASGDEASQLKIPFVRDDNILKVLDKLVWYLRVTHSVDYYNHGEYPNEDEMPNRCGLIHVRGPPPGPGIGHNEAGTNPETGKPCTMVPSYWVNEFIRSFEIKLEPLLTAKDKITDDEAMKLGKKDPDKEVEAFINANCIELAKEKWLCPLSGKKFKGPDFVRKHILNKHVEKVEEVKAEVAYFNNFVYDAKRPGLPEKPMPSIPSLVGGDRGGGGHLMDERPPRSGSSYGGGGGSNYARSYPSERPAVPDLFDTERYERPTGYGGGGGGGYQQYGGNNRVRGSGGGGGYRNRDQYNYNRSDGFGNQLPPRGNYGRGPANGRHDPRSVITYTDLDAPEEDRF